MKKTVLLLALALSSTMIFAGCSSMTNSETYTESSTNVVNEASENGALNNVINTKWVLTDGTAGVITANNLTDAMNLTLEFKEDGKVIFTSNNSNPKEYAYSYDYTDRDECCFYITGERNNAILAHVQGDTMTFQIFNTTLIFTKQ